MRSFLFWLSFMCLAHGLWGQLPNDSIYQRLINQYFEQHPGPYQRVEGLGEAWLPSDLALDSSVQLVAIILSADVQYQPTVDERFVRQITVPIQLEDSLLQSDQISYADTLTNGQLRRVLRKSSLPLQGEDPRQFSRWGRPALLIGGTALGTVLLFVVRSL